MMWVHPFLTRARHRLDGQPKLWREIDVGEPPGIHHHPSCMPFKPGDLLRLAQAVVGSSQVQSQVMNPCSMSIAARQPR